MIVTLLYAAGIAAGDGNRLHGTHWLTVVAAGIALAAALFFVLRGKERWRYSMGALCVMAVAAGWVADRASWGSIEAAGASIYMEQDKAALSTGSLPHAHQATIVTQPTALRATQQSSGGDTRGSSTMTVEFDDGRRTRLYVPLRLIATDSLAIGQRIAFTGRLRPIEMDAADEWLDYQLHLLRQGIVARSHARDMLIVSQPRNPLLRLRRTLQRGIDSLHVGRDNRALVRALLLADRSQLDGGATDDFRRAGVSHLLALSGMHLSVIVGLLVLLFGLDVRDRWRNFFCISLMVWAYVAVAGSPVSLTRAAWFCTLMLFGSALRRHAMLFDTLWCTLLIMLVASPQSLFDAGLQLSFCSVAAIAFVGWQRDKRLVARPDAAHRQAVSVWLRLWRRLRQAAVISLACTVATMPVAYLSFGQVSLFSVPATILMAPVTLAIIVVTIAALAIPLPCLSDLLSQLLELLCAIDYSLAHVFASLAGMIQ